MAPPTTGGDNHYFTFRGKARGGKDYSFRAPARAGLESTGMNAMLAKIHAVDGLPGEG